MRTPELHADPRGQEDILQGHGFCPSETISRRRACFVQQVPSSIMLALVCIVSLLAFPRTVVLTSAMPLVSSQLQRASRLAVLKQAQAIGRKQRGSAGQERPLPNLTPDAGESAASAGGTERRYWRRQQQEQNQQQQTRSSGMGVADTGKGAAVARSSTPKKPEFAVMSDRQQVPVSERCVFILGTGRSGSTSLLDAVNQLPNYLIRGEQKAAFLHLFETWRLLGETANLSKELSTFEQEAEARYGEQGAAWLTYDTVKGVYDKNAVLDKLPWFNDLHRLRLADAARSFYSLTYGYHGPGIVSGFKEIRFGCGRGFRTQECKYERFTEFLNFLRMLCQDVKVLLNSRASHSAEENAKLGGMLARFGVVNDTSIFEDGLKVTHEWYDRYAASHPDLAFRVIMEDMFNPQTNVSLARRMLTFLGEDPDTPIRFDRMPTWSLMTDDHAAKPHVA